MVRKWYDRKYFELSNITYHPVFQDVRKILEKLHVILASDDGHKIVFPDVPMIGFKNNKNLKAHLVR